MLTSQQSIEEDLDKLRTENQRLKSSQKVSAHSPVKSIDVERDLELERCRQELHTQQTHYEEVINTLRAELELVLLNGTSVDSSHISNVNVGVLSEESHALKHMITTLEQVCNV